MGPSLVAQWERIHLPMQETQVQSLSQEDPLEKGMATTPVFLPGKFLAQRCLVGYSPRGHKRIGHNSMTKQQQQEFMKLPSIVMLTDGSGNKDTKG